MPEIQLPTATKQNDIQSKVTDILNYMVKKPASFVKSVQRGVVSVGVSDAVVNISPVDTSKSLVFIWGAGNGSESRDYATPSYVKDFTSTSFVIGRLPYSTSNFSWQVIEFY